jgi:hypothetical protein
MQLLSVFVLSPEEFQDDYNDEDYDLIVVDDFAGSPESNFMIKLTGGDTMKIKRKAQTAYTKLRRLPVLIISNLPPDQVYAFRSPAIKEAWLDRLEVVHFDRPVTVEVKVDDCSICMESLTTGNLRELECRHAFHVSCIAPWLVEHKTCPCCRLANLE